MTGIVLPILIFLFRIVDVTFGTIRIIFVSKGYKLFAAVCGFFEVLIWITVISRLMTNTDNFFHYVAYAAGFSMGNYIGLTIAEKLSLGVILLRIVVPDHPTELISELKEMNYGVTILKGKGAIDDVNVVFLIVKKKDLELVINKIKLHNPNAFYSIENIESVSSGVFPKKTSFSVLSNFNYKKILRNGK